MVHYYNITSASTSEQFLVMLNNASNGFLGISMLIVVSFLVIKDFNLKKLGAISIVISLVSIFLTLIGVVIDSVTISIILITAALFIYIVLS